MCIFVKERKPKSSVKASILADDYVQARKGITTMSQAPLKRIFPVKCFSCGKPGHVKKDCLHDPDKLLGEKRQSTTRNSEKPKRDIKDMKCFNCQQKGYLAANCPNDAMFCSERPVDYKGNSVVQKVPAVCTQGLHVAGKVDGIPVEPVILDTGWSRTLVRSDLGSQNNQLEGEAVAIRCAHGDTVLYPPAKVHLEINGCSIDVEAAVSDSLRMPVSLGTDVPQLQDLIGQALSREPLEVIEDVMAVTARAQYSKQKQQDTMLHQADKLSGTVPMALDAGAPKDLNVETATQREFKNCQLPA